MTNKNLDPPTNQKVIIPSEIQSLTPGDWVLYLYNNGNGNRQSNGQVTSLVNEYCLEIDNEPTPYERIIKKVTVLSDEWLEFDVILEAARNGEKGSAKLFAQMFYDKIVYDHTENAWYFWNGINWSLDRVGQITNTVSDELSAQYTHGLATAIKKYSGDDSWQAKLLSKVKGALNYKSSIKNVLSLVSVQPGIAITGDEWGKDPWLMGVANGIIDLHSGKGEHSEPSDYIKIISPTLWQGDDAPCDRFKQFMIEIFNGDTEKIKFIQRLLGYSLIGEQVDHILPILCGSDGRNGKSVLLSILRHVLGPYISPVAEEVLLSGKSNPGAATPFLAMLRGKRIVYITETDEGDRLDAGTVKQLTGNDAIIARNLYGKPFTFEPSHTVFLITNHTPHANSDDEALWERVVLLEFTQRFVDEPTEPNEHKRDPYLIKELEREASGILAWLIHGCMYWQKYGLNIPQSVKLATETYRQGEDSLGKFLDECCTQNPDDEILARDFYIAYKDWSKDNGASKPMSSTAFGKRMSKRFDKKKEGGSGRAIYLGVKLSFETMVIDLNSF